MRLWSRRAPERGEAVAGAEESAAEFDPPPESEPVPGAAGAWARALARVGRILRGRGAGVEPVIVFGSGSEARQAIAALRASGLFFVAGVVSDAAAARRPRLPGRRTHDLEALPALCRERGARTVIVAAGAMDDARREALRAAIARAGATAREFAGLAERAARWERDFDVSDLLSRPQNAFCSAEARRRVEGRAILVTGAGGSIGSALCRALVGLGARRLVLYEISEYALYQIDAELRALRSEGKAAPDCEVVPVLGSVCDALRLRRAIAAHGVEVVYHAAAYKHVPLVESNAIEGARNNTIGTFRVIEAVRACGVGRMVFVSTDKAVRPTNVMGASKRMAEMLVQDAQRRSGCAFAIVRFGNVLGSSGSVIPLFRAQIDRGGPVTVTHPEMTRYFMTIPEAASLVIHAGAIAEGGEVFLLDMGEPVRILDLARRMIELSGRRPLMPGETGSGIPIVFTGPRDGEKLYEELLIDADATPSAHPKIARARESCPPPEVVQALFARLSAAVEAGDVAQTVAVLGEAVDGYTPSGRHADAASRSGAFPDARQADRPSSVRLSAADGRPHALRQGGSGA